MQAYSVQCNAMYADSHVVISEYLNTPNLCQLHQTQPPCLQLYPHRPRSDFSGKTSNQRRESWDGHPVPQQQPTFAKNTLRLDVMLRRAILYIGHLKA